jgi:hypothetical protein
MVVDGSNRENVIWLGVDAVITTSLPITLPHAFINVHPIIHFLTRPIIQFDSLGDSSDSPISPNCPSTMSTPLLQQFPSLSGYPTSFLKDLLSSPQLVEAYLFTLPQIQELAAEVERLSKENEDLASESGLIQDIVELTSRG